MCATGRMEEPQSGGHLCGKGSTSTSIRSPRMRWLLALMILLLGVAPARRAEAQSPVGGLPGLGGQLGGGDVGQPGLAPGGAAMADFDTLMNLIQQTIDPDSWLANGGTNTILPYPAGVYVDPRGHLERVAPAEQRDRSLLAGSSLPPAAWQSPSGLRVVSLKRLEAALTQSLQAGLNPSKEVRKLAGLSSIRFVQIDAEQEDILLAGPAGNGMFGFELQDVAVVAALINQRTTPLGCSIEPTNAGLLAVQDLIRAPSTAKQLARNPRLVVEHMQDKIGDHEVKIFGLPVNSGTAIALLDADEHMKQLGFGVARAPVRINSYFDYLDQQAGTVSQQSVIRWWFAFADKPVKSNEAGELFELPENCVAVLSEQQWVTQVGRVPSGGQDPAADAFAKGLTAQLDALRSTHESYARLHAVFELSLAMQLAIEATGQPNLQAWLPTLCSLGASPSGNPTPRTVSGLTTWHKLRNNTVVAVVSGGVEIDTARLANKERWRTSRYLASSLVPEAPEILSAAQGNWWWDTP